MDQDNHANYWQVLISPRNASLDARGQGALDEIHGLGLDHITRVRAERLYFLLADLSEAQVHAVGAELLTDHVTETCSCRPGLTERAQNGAVVEVHYLPGVMNTAALSTRAAINELLASRGDSQRVAEVRTAWRYEIDGAKCVADLEKIAGRVLANGCIERAIVNGFDRHDELPGTFPQARLSSFELKSVPLCGLDDAGLTTLSRQGHLFLSLAEMQAIRTYFQKLGKEPTDLELETIAQTWSEHCGHKTLKSEVTYRGPGFGSDQPVEVHYDNLLVDTIVKATNELDRDWCLSVFVDNAGVITFDDEHGVAFKVETHNHPSAIEPYGGAATGIGGCIRDIMGCGLGAKPVASTDVFCFAPPDYPKEKLPKGVLHPRRTFAGVVRGVRDYGNRMGIPTVNGAIHFDERYLANPLVFCGCVGIIPRNRIDKIPQRGDRVVLVGGQTGRDGIHGATFSSAELTETHADEFSHAVQIGNPIEEKKVLDGLLRARDAGDCLFTAVTDCGAGGLSSAVGEMAETLGAVVNLEKVPLKYAGLSYEEIWISEAQERMVLSVPPENLEAVITIFAEEEVEATDIGEFTGDGKLHLRFNGVTVGELDTQFLHGGLPKQRREAVWVPPPAKPRPAMSLVGQDLTERLYAELSDPDAASKEWVIRQYDHEVQGGSVIKPLVGPGSGPSDAAVVRPRLDSDRGIALACGLASDLSDIDPYWMAIASIDESVRNVTCIGGDPQRTAILDNFCWGSVSDAQAMGTLVRACQGAYDAASAYGLPFISGKDSLNNQFTQDPTEAKRLGISALISIPNTLLISAISVLADVNRCISSDFKQAGNRIVLIQPAGMGFNLEAAHVVHLRVKEAISSGSVLAAHDVSEGGFAATVAEMCIGGSVGATLDLTAILSSELRTYHGLPSNSKDRDTVAASLFGPRMTAYCLEVIGDADIPGAVLLGHVADSGLLGVTSQGTELISAPVDQLARSWKEPFAQGPGGDSRG